MENLFRELTYGLVSRKAEAEKFITFIAFVIPAKISQA